MITEAALAFLPIARNSIEEEYQQLIKRQAKENRLRVSSSLEE